MHWQVDNECDLQDEYDDNVDEKWMDFCCICFVKLMGSNVDKYCWERE